MIIADPEAIEASEFLVAKTGNRRNSALMPMIIRTTIVAPS
jgi:hypothetical protein